MSVEYSPEDREVMITSAYASNDSRLQELIDFARLSGYQKLGIACCAKMQPYAEKLEKLLKTAGFEVFRIHCHESGLEASEFSEDLQGKSCDPLSQAEYLNEHKTDLNINVGLCLGHELLFEQHSAAPVTTFLVKDFATGHKTVENLI